ncbi:hypothetical protein D3C81_2329030 [compost metagenome]
MNRAAIQDLGISLPPPETDAAAVATTERPAALRFTTPFYYRKPNHPFLVSVLIDPDQLA